jgi:mRNA-degrading endonuclease toxin of MazEF toxin-antitoxin module
VLPCPRRGEIWTGNVVEPPARHLVLTVSLNARNESNRVNSVLVVPFSSTGVEGPTVLRLPAGETGLPFESYLKAHFISTLPKSWLLNYTRRQFSSSRMHEVGNRSTFPTGQKVACNSLQNLHFLTSCA